MDEDFGGVMVAVVNRPRDQCLLLRLLLPLMILAVILATFAFGFRLKIFYFLLMMIDLLLNFHLVALLPAFVSCVWCVDFGTTLSPEFPTIVANWPIVFALRRRRSDFSRMRVPVLTTEMERMLFEFALASETAAEEIPPSANRRQDEHLKINLLIKR